MRNIGKSILAATIAASLMMPATVCASDRSPWLGESGAGSITVGYGEQSADRFYAGDTELPLPTDLELRTSFLELSYAITDRLTLDAQISHGDSDFLVDPVLAPEGGDSSLGDSRIGLRYSLYSENGAAVAVRATAILDGGYDVGAITAIGDGGNGGEIALLAGKAFESGLSISGEVGYRSRDNSVPDDWFASVIGAYAFSDTFGAYLGYDIARADSDLNIGGPGFSPARFPEVDEDYDLIHGGISVGFGGGWGGSLGYGSKLDGRNTAKSDFWNVAVSYSF